MAQARIRMLQKCVRWYYRNQFVTLAIGGLMTPILVVAVLVTDLGGHTLAELRTHQDRLVHVLAFFGLFALCSLVAGLVFTMSAWVLWLERGSDQVRGRGWPILGCSLITLLFIGLSLRLEHRISWALPMAATI